jgi:farnesyl diphosphate synthase
MDARVKSEAARQFDFKTWSDKQLARVEQALHSWVSADAPAGLGDAMRYAVLDGGKRLRPLLVFAACEAVAGDETAGRASHSEAALRASHHEATLRASHHEAALRAACAVELIHAYSLVHDDMPCMDNDILRRGKPTVHVKFGQAQALLAGDALQALAFDILTASASVPAATQATLCRLLARASGASGMAGGQAIDLANVGQPLGEDALRHMHQLKTGALLQASVEMGAACGDAPPSAREALRDYGSAMGLAFQVVDDILDVTQDAATLGKTAGKDAAQQKPTYVSLMGLARSRAYAQDLHHQALQALARSGLPRTQALAALADMVVQRSS